MSRHDVHGLSVCHGPVPAYPHRHPLRSIAAWSLGQLQPPAAESQLARAARDRRWEVRTNAVAALARLNAARWRPLLRGLATDDSPYVRANAALALSWTGDTSAAALLAERLQSDRSPWVRASALRGLVRLAPDTVPLSDGRGTLELRALLQTVANEDPDHRVRRVAASLRSPPPADPPKSWITLHLMDQEDQPLRNGSFVLILPSGLVRASWSDGLGEAWVESIEGGHCFVELPQTDG